MIFNYRVSHSALYAKAALALGIAVLCSGCCKDPWSAFPETTPPDKQCEVGGSTHGDDVYIWECLRGERVVVAAYSAEMSCSAPRRATAACGSVTTLETSLQLKPADCSAARSGRAWR